MRALTAISVLVWLAAGSASAQAPSTGLSKAPGAASAASNPAQPPSSKDATNEALASCLSQWDRSTHMTKRDWARACRRVADRLQNLIVK